MQSDGASFGKNAECRAHDGAVRATPEVAASRLRLGASGSFSVSEPVIP